jgi:hypothetical protein
MPAYNFKTQFAPLVKSGAKRCTIRQPRKRPTKAGDMLSLYTGMRQKGCTLLLRAKCVRVAAIEIHATALILPVGSALTIESLAQRDGFPSPLEFLDFFRNQYGLPFKGELIEW